ncbi:MAG: plastocyanin/azurin family copper-binding protein, partial [Rudaea sp.]
MHLQSQRFLLLIALAFGLCQAGFAKNWVVQVGGTTGGGYYGGGTTPVLAFSPTPLTINAGDSVTFTNLGGAAHNIHADDDSFRCAAGCRGDGSGAMGDPDSSGWSDTITFSKPGTINYHCDQHVSMGMTGSIVVNAVAPLPFAIGGYISGNWYNPQQGGHGFQIIASNAIDTATNLPIMNAIWFV